TLIAAAPFHSPESETSITPERRRQTFSAPPWSAHVNEAGLEVLSIQRQLLIGVGVMLCRAPRHARSPKFAQEVQFWQSAVSQIRFSPLISQAAPGDSRETEAQIE